MKGCQGSACTFHLRSTAIVAARHSAGVLPHWSFALSSSYNSNGGSAAPTTRVAIAAVASDDPGSSSSGRSSSLNQAPPIPLPNSLLNSLSRSLFLNLSDVNPFFSFNKSFVCDTVHEQCLHGGGFSNTVLSRDGTVAQLCLSISYSTCSRDTTRQNINMV